jgi:hypothetical protein
MSREPPVGGEEERDSSRRNGGTGFGLGSKEGCVAPPGLGGLGFSSQRLRAGLMSAAHPALGLG